ncbi:MAG: PLP-dependent aminotransferase family protein [Desulfobulbaceae bacterium]|nr:MAG: PLP-dependent aminotransferase family protein [Desulfobulbaceae bacterium]
MDHEHLYVRVANRITDMIDNGTFKVGDRVPSIRELSRQASVSINTVKEAYTYLEDRRFIEARPQSGFYVCPKPLGAPSEPQIVREKVSPSKISTGELVVRVMRDVLERDKIQFGAAIPDPALVPTAKLSRILASEIRHHKEESTRYSIPPGNPLLRSQISQWMIKAGCTLNPDEIVITAGASEAVFLSLQAICRPGDTVAISSPIYFNFIQMLKLLDLRVVEIPNSPREGLHLESLRRAIKSHDITCCLVVSNYDNPLGSCMSNERKQELVELLNSVNITLIEDDINGDLCHQGDRPSVAKAWDRQGNVVLCSSFSKTLAPGYRIGWVAPGKYTEEVMRLKLTTGIGVASPTQLAVAEFLKNGGYLHHLRAIRKAYAAKIAKMTEAISEYFPGGTRVSRPKGGFTLWLEMAEKIDGVSMYAQAVKSGITLAPGSLFSLSNNYRNCIRLNGAFWSEENRWAVKRLGEIAAAQL